MQCTNGVRVWENKFGDSSGKLKSVAICEQGYKGVQLTLCTLLRKVKTSQEVLTIDLIGYINGLNQPKDLFRDTK